MRERPILFSGEMVRAILEGRKTQTRRVVTPQPMMFDGRRTMPFDGDADVLRQLLETCPFGQAGDRLWVRESFAPLRVNGFDLVAYRATCADDSFDFAHPAGFVERIHVKKWKPSIYMPRRMARLLLEVTEVRVERLQDITEEDSRAEGVQPAETTKGDPSFALGFLDLWESINGKRKDCAWEDNPWVWAVSFRRVGEVRDA